jgi:hypothetical protein
MERYCPQCRIVFKSGRNKCHRCDVTTLATDKTRAAQAAGRPDCATCGGSGKGHYDGQIGAEATPSAYIDSLIDCTREWMRVLKPTGSMWINLGDSYAGGGGQWAGDTRPDPGRRRAVSGKVSTAHRKGGAPAKSLRGLPWRYTIRCIDDLGLILRAEVIWSKPNGLPESVTDRVRRSHEQWFHLVKSPRYFSAVDAIREEHTGPWNCGPGAGRKAAAGRLDTLNAGLSTSGPHPLGKLPGSVWTVATQPLTVPAELGVDHFAAFPMEWPRRIVLGWSPAGICTACGEGRRPAASVGEHQQAGHGGNYAATAYGAGNHGTGGSTLRTIALRTITGEACACPDTSAPTRPSVVVDPFGGTGTTALVAHAYGRHGISVDMSSDYCRLAAWRTSNPGQLAAALEVEKPAVQHVGQLDLFDGVAS